MKTALMWLAVPIGSPLGAYLAQASILFAWEIGWLVIPHCDEPGLLNLLDGIAGICPDRLFHWGAQFVASIVVGLIAVWLPFRIAPSHKRIVALIFGIALALFFIGLNMVGLFALFTVPVREFPWLETVNGWITGIAALVTMWAIRQNYAEASQGDSLEGQ